MAGLTALKRKNFQDGGTSWGPGVGSPGTTKSGKNKNPPSNDGGSDARSNYIRDYVSKGIVKVVELL